MTALAPAPIGVWSQSRYNQAALDALGAAIPPSEYDKGRFRAPTPSRHTPAGRPGVRPTRLPYPKQAALGVIAPAAPPEAFDAGRFRAPIPSRHTPAGIPASAATEAALVSSAPEASSRSAAALEPEQVAATPAATVELLRAAEEAFRPTTEAVDALVPSGDDEADLQALEEATAADKAATEAAYSALLALANRVKAIAAIAKARRLTDDETRLLASIHAEVLRDLGARSAAAASVEAAAPAVEVATRRAAREADVAMADAIAAAEDADQKRTQAEDEVDALNEALDEDEFHRRDGLLLEKARRLRAKIKDAGDRRSDISRDITRGDKSKALDPIDRARLVKQRNQATKKLEEFKKQQEAVVDARDRLVAEWNDNADLLGDAERDASRWEGVTEQSAAEADRQARVRDQMEAAAEEASHRRPQGPGFTKSWTAYEGDRKRLADVLAERVRRKMLGDIEEIPQKTLSAISPSLVDVAAVAHNRGEAVLEALKVYNAAKPQRSSATGRFESAAPKDIAAADELRSRMSMRIRAPNLFMANVIRTSRASP